MIFGDDLAPLAVLDWDMASIGAPEHDVAWFTTIESTTRTLLGQHLDGLPGPRRHDRAVRVAAAGAPLRDFEWYEILAMIRSTAIMTRIGYLHRDAGLPSPHADRRQPAPRSARGAHRRGRRHGALEDNSVDQLTLSRWTPSKMTASTAGTSPVFDQRWRVPFCT